MAVNPGLKSKLAVMTSYAGVYLNVRDKVHQHNGVWVDNMVKFLSLLPPFPAFSGLALSSELIQPSFASLTHAIATVMPNFRALSLALPPSYISNDNLDQLQSFTALQHLNVEEAHVDLASVTWMCTSMKRLETLVLRQSATLSLDDGKSLNYVLAAQGHAGVVFVFWVAANLSRHVYVPVTWETHFETHWSLAKYNPEFLSPSRLCRQHHHYYQ